MRAIFGGARSAGAGAGVSDVLVRARVRVLGCAVRGPVRVLVNAPPG
jgi:hypothetical protein